MMSSTRKQAKLLNEKYFFTGKPCKNGHVSKRFTHNGVCYECCQKASLECYHKRKTDSEKNKRVILTRIKQRAKREGIPFNITENDLVWNESCPIFGVDIDYTQNPSLSNNWASVDRIDPSKGYVVGNVRIVSMRANRAKWNLTDDEIVLLYNDALNRLPE